MHLLFFFPAILLLSLAGEEINLSPFFFALIGSSTQKQKSLLTKFKSFVFSFPKTKVYKISLIGREKKIFLKMKKIYFQ